MGKRKPMKTKALPSKPRRLKLSTYSEATAARRFDGYCICSIDRVYLYADGARELAKWLLAFAEWAEMRESKL